MDWTDILRENFEKAGIKIEVIIPGLDTRPKTVRDTVADLQRLGISSITVEPVVR